MDRQPSVHVFFRLVVEDVHAAVGAEVEDLVLVLGFAVQELRGIVRLGVEAGPLTHLAQLRQHRILERLPFLLQLTPVFVAWPVILVEGVRIFFGEPVHLFFRRCPDRKAHHIAVGVEHAPHLV